MPEAYFSDALFLTKNDAELDALTGIDAPEFKDQFANGHFAVSINRSFQTKTEDVFR